MDQSLSDSVLVQLAMDINPKKLTDLGVRLGYKIARIDQFKYNNPGDILKATVDMFCDYRDEKMQGFDESVVVEKLCEALKKADSEEVAEKLRSGRFNTIPCSDLGMYKRSSTIALSLYAENIIKHSHMYWFN